MMRFLHILLMISLFLSSTVHAETNTPSVQIAFVRDGYLWLKTEDKEEKLTDGKAVFPYPPQWSFDGKMLLYQKEVTGSIIGTSDTSNELWVYDTATNKHQKFFYDGYNPKWSPTENSVAFNQAGVLNISNFKGFYNIALGVDDYEWLPNGKGFIASSSASLRPDGWTHPVLYTISIEEGYQNLSSLTKHVKKLFVIPKEVGKNDVKILSIGAEKFAFSPNGQWISFVISPTASWAMDSDMLAIISADGTDFEIIDEVILEFTPQWALTQNTLGYIAGGGRIVFGFKNKNLKVTEFPSSHTVNLTPENYAEMGFAWVDDNSLIVSRVQETEWSNDPEERPKPILYFLSLSEQRQVKLTDPPKGEGDYEPQFVPSINKITWIRKNDLAESSGDLWLADLNGEDAKVWIHEVESYAFYPS